MRTCVLLLCGLLVAGCGESASQTTPDGVPTAENSGEAPNVGANASSGNKAETGTTQNESTSAESEPGSSSQADSQGVMLAPSNTKIEFVGSKPDGTKHTGGFREFSGRIELGPQKQMVQAVALDIQTASLWADEKKLENHLKSPDFFKVREHPTAGFQSTSVETTDAGQQKVTGKLTLLGETKEISFPAEVTAQGNGWRLESQFTIDRTRFGMTYGEGEINKDVAIRVSVATSGGSTSQGGKTAKPSSSDQS